MNLARTSFGFPAIFILATALSARAEDTIGKATAVIPAASYARGTQVAALEINDAVVQNDRVKTSGKGSTQLRFVDGTTLSIGPGSDVLLDRAIFDGGKAQDLTVQVVRGAMRFATGTSDHSVYHVKTVVAQIGVRGTVIDVAYENNKTIYRTVEGEAEVCMANRAECREVRAGDPPIAVTLQGIVLATAAEIGRVFRTLDTVTTALTDQAKTVLRGATDIVEPPLSGVGKAVQGIDNAVQDLGKGVVKGIQRTLQGPPPDNPPPNNR